MKTFFCEKWLLITKFLNYKLMLIQDWAQSFSLPCGNKFLLVLIFAIFASSFFRISKRKVLAKKKFPQKLLLFWNRKIRLPRKFSVTRYSYHFSAWQCIVDIVRRNHFNLLITLRNKMFILINDFPLFLACVADRLRTISRILWHVRLHRRLVHCFKRDIKSWSLE